MKRIKHIFIWLSRMNHTLGFGVQSPTDYRFVRSVINQHSPYYAYHYLGKDDSWLRRKLGKLYFRLVNERQPAVIVDQIGVVKYLQAASAKASVVSQADYYELAFLPIETDVNEVFSKCDEHSMVVFEGINRHEPLWKCIIHDKRVTIAYDLYYCGIVTFEKNRAKQSYQINF